MRFVGALTATVAGALLLASLLEQALSASRIPGSIVFQATLLDLGIPMLLATGIAWWIRPRWLAVPSWLAIAFFGNLAMVRIVSGGAI